MISLNLKYTNSSSGKELTTMITTKNTALSAVKRFFEDNPEVSYKEFEAEVYKTFLKVQEEAITPYKPIEVPALDKNISEYETREYHEETKSIDDIDPFDY